MRYFTWKIDWSSGFGTDPTSTINTEIIRFEPAFATGPIADANTLVYCYLLQGEIDASQLAQWSVTETTVEAMLSAAQSIEPLAVVTNGLVSFPKHNNLT